MSVEASQSVEAATMADETSAPNVHDREQSAGAQEIAVARKSDERSADGLPPDPESVKEKGASQPRSVRAETSADRKRRHDNQKKVNKFKRMTKLYDPMEGRKRKERNRDNMDVESCSAVFELP
nr:uncharacterized protein LOC113818772 [Penaeus vannamei]